MTASVAVQRVVAMILVSLASGDCIASNLRAV